VVAFASVGVFLAVTEFKCKILASLAEVSTHKKTKSMLKRLPIRAIWLKTCMTREQRT